MAIRYPTKDRGQPNKCWLKDRSDGVHANSSKLSNLDVASTTPVACTGTEETMTLRKILLAAAVVLSVPVMPALAHDDEKRL